MGALTSDDDPWTGSIIALVDAYRRGTHDPGTELERTLAAIERSQLGAVCHLAADAARESAERVDLGGPLAGVPFLVKETERVEGWPSTEASRPLRDRRATVTSTQVSRLRAAGAIPIGQSTSAEFARAGYTSTTLHGTTRNPWDLSRTPGGSSGGGAAAVAGGLVALATATDGGGSIRLPAAYCGLPGLKTTTRLVPAGPLAILSPPTVAIGCLTRTVADLALVLDLTCGPDGRDPMCVTAPIVFTAQLTEVIGPGLRIAYLPHLGGNDPDDSTASLVEGALSELVALLQLRRVEVVDGVPAPDPRLGLAGALRIHALVGHASEEEQAAMNPEVQAGLQAARAASLDDLATADQARTAVIEAVADLFDSADLVATPTVPTEAFRAEGPPPRNPAAALGPISIAGYPAISLPVGTGPDATPIGLQLVGRPLDDALLVAIVHRWEGHRPWPLVAPGAPW